MSNIPLIVLLSEDHAGCKEQFAIDFGVAINVHPRQILLTAIEILYPLNYVNRDA